MNKEEKIREITRILHVHERNSKADLAKKIVKALEEAPEDDLTPGDICEVWDGALTHQIAFFCGTVNGEKRFSVYRYNISNPERGFSYDHYRKIDVFDVLADEIGMIGTYKKSGYCWNFDNYLYRPEGR
jgi:hypothetical protein